MLAGALQVRGNVLFYEDVAYRNTSFQRVEVTCSAEAIGGTFLPACTMVPVDSVQQVYTAGLRLQDVGTPLVIAMSHDINFTLPAWPDDGLRIMSNVSLTAFAGVTLVMDFGLKTTLFVVNSSSEATAFLTIRGFVMLNLPLTYLPLEHPRRPFGVLSTSLWPVYRQVPAP